MMGSSLIYLFNLDLEGGCCATKRGIERPTLNNNILLCIEIDEVHHKSYIQTDEEHRYDDLFMDFSVNTFFSGRS